MTDALAEIMQLGYSYPSKGRMVAVYTSCKDKIDKKIFIPEQTENPILCAVEPGLTRDEFYIHTERVAQAVACDIIRKGGALIHGGLCSLHGNGAIMAGHGGIGKSTSSKRLPSPWISYCDDSTLVIPEYTGVFTAHPWPTWSKFYWGGPGGSWPVEEKLPLKAIFFLGQSEEDQLIPVNKAGAKSMLLDTIEHVTRTGNWQGEERNSFILQRLKSSDAIASIIPAYRLKISLNGSFWDLMERVMPEDRPKPCIVSSKHEANSKTFESTINIDFSSKQFIYRGTSMNPTFFEPEILIVEPYGVKTPKKGDIVCYKIDNDSEGIVHRIIKVKGSAITTRGDNNNLPDEYVVNKESIIGKVVAAEKDNQAKPILSGYAGLLNMYYNRIYRFFNKVITTIFYGFYHGLADIGLLRLIKPSSMDFKVVVFQRRYFKSAKLILKGRTVGNFNSRKKAWSVKRPYSLFIDRNKLPHPEGARLEHFYKKSPFKNDNQD